MKHVKLLTILFCLFISVNSFAYTEVTLGDLKYRLNGTEAYVSGYVGNPTDVVIPATIATDGQIFRVTQINARAFDGCKSLTSVKAEGNNLTTINARAFANCTSLKKVWFPSITTISRVINYSPCGAFSNCTSLTYVVIPETCLSIDKEKDSGTWDYEHAFSGCTRLQTIIYLGETNFGSLGSNANTYTAKDIVKWSSNEFWYSGVAPVVSLTSNLPTNFTFNGNNNITVVNKDAGTYTQIIPFTFANDDWSFEAEVPYTYTINKVPLTVKVNDASRIYGDNNPAFSITYSGFINGENESVITTEPTITTTATASSNVGTYPISISGGSAKNYTFKYEQGTLTINKAALEVSVNDATKAYGSVNPTFTLRYSGLKNNETKPSWNKSPTFSTSADKNSNVGSYQVTADCSATNYNITKITPGTLTITPADLTIKANNASRLYFDADPEFTYVATGFLNGDTDASFIHAPKFKTDATTTSNVGAYTITPYGAESKNYNIKYETGNLTITKRKLTATADAISREYGENNPVFTVSYDGFVNNDNESALDVIPSATTSATPTSNVGTYTISLNGGSATNYDLSLKSGVLTIKKAPLSIVINDATRCYGASNSSFGAIYSGLKNGETIPVWSASPSFKTSATVSSAVGSYPIEMASGTPKNYEISGVTNGTLSITPAKLTIKAKDASKTYFEENPAFTYVCTGFVNGDNSSTALQVPPTLSTVANQSSNAGSYEIVAKDASSNNYDIVYTPGVFTINKKQLVAKVGNYERIYGEENPIFSIEYEGFAGNDSESSLSAKPTAKSPATITSNVGTYPINVSGGDATNYKFSYTSGVLTINKAEQTIEWNQDLSNVQVGSQVELTAKASSGLPVEYTMESNYSASLYKVGTKTYIDCVAAGQIVLRASQPGNNNYYGTPRATNAINIVGNTIADPTLTIIQGEKGLIKTQVAKGSVYTFSIEATEGWKIHSVSFNDEDITEQLDANNRFTTPNINVSATLNVVYESSPDGIASAKVSSAKILGTSSGIKVENARPNEVLKIYTIDGKLVKNQKIQSSEVNIDLPNNKIYLITLENLRVKVRL